VYEKVSKDIGKVMEFIDVDKTGFFNVKQTG